MANPAINEVQQTQDAQPQPRSEEILPLVSLQDLKDFSDLIKQKPSDLIQAATDSLAVKELFKQDDGKESPVKTAALAEKYIASTERDYLESLNGTLKTKTFEPKKTLQNQDGSSFTTDADGRIASFNIKTPPGAEGGPRSYENIKYNEQGQVQSFKDPYGIQRDRLTSKKMSPWQTTSTEKSSSDQILQDITFSEKGAQYWDHHNKTMFGRTGDGGIISISRTNDDNRYDNGFQTTFFPPDCAGPNGGRCVEHSTTTIHGKPTPEKALVVNNYRTGELTTVEDGVIKETKTASERLEQQKDEEQRQLKAAAAQAEKRILAQEQDYLAYRNGTYKPTIYEANKTLQNPDGSSFTTNNDGRISTFTRKPDAGENGQAESYTDIKYTDKGFVKSFKDPYGMQYDRVTSEKMSPWVITNTNFSKQSFEKGVEKHTTLNKRDITFSEKGAQFWEGRAKDLFAPLSDGGSLSITRTSDASGKDSGFKTTVHPKDGWNAEHNIEHFTPTINGKPTPEPGVIVSHYKARQDLTVVDGRITKTHSWPEPMPYVPDDSDF